MKDKIKYLIGIVIVVVSASVLIYHLTKYQHLDLKVKNDKDIPAYILFKADNLSTSLDSDMPFNNAYLVKDGQVKTYPFVPDSYLNEVYKDKYTKNIYLTNSMNCNIDVYKEDLSVKRYDVCAKEKLNYIPFTIQPYKDLNYVLLFDSEKYDNDVANENEEYALESKLIAYDKNFNKIKDFSDLKNIQVFQANEDYLYYVKEKVNQNGYLSKDPVQVIQRDLKTNGQKSVFETSENENIQSLYINNDKVYIELYNYVKETSRFGVIETNKFKEINPDSSKKDSLKVVYQDEEQLYLEYSNDADNTYIIDQANQLRKINVDFPIEDVLKISDNEIFYQAGNAVMVEDLKTKDSEKHQLPYPESKKELENYHLEFFKE